MRPGGVVEVNGRKASLKVRGYELLREGQSYIFFLYWSPYSEAYILAGGISGVVEVKSNLRVKPLASAEKIKFQYDDADLESFINDVIRD